MSSTDINPDGNIIYKGSRISLGTVVIREEGSSRTRLKEIVYHPGAVVIIPITSEGQIVLVEQYRISLNQTLIELPAGTRENGEDYLEVADRELSEETKFGARKLVDIGTMYPAPGFCNEEQRVIVATDLYPRDLPADFGENIKVVTMSPSAIREAIIEGSIRDAKTIAALYLANLKSYIKM